MPPDLSDTPALVGRALLNGAIWALAFIAAVHLLRPAARRILFIGLLVAALVYVRAAARANMGPVWLAIELLGVAIYAAIGWKGLRGSLWWLAAAWALHVIWDVGLHVLGPGTQFKDPLSYAIPCVSFDLLVAAYISYLATRESRSGAALTLRAGARAR